MTTRHQPHAGHRAPGTALAPGRGPAASASSRACRSGPRQQAPASPQRVPPAKENRRLPARHAARNGRPAARPVPCRSRCFPGALPGRAAGPAPRPAGPARTASAEAGC